MLGSKSLGRGVLSDFFSKKKWGKGQQALPHFIYFSMKFGEYNVPMTDGLDCRFVNNQQRCQKGTMNISPYKTCFSPSLPHFDIPNKDVILLYNVVRTWDSWRICLLPKNVFPSFPPSHHNTVILMLPINKHTIVYAQFLKIVCMHWHNLISGYCCIISELKSFGILATVHML